MDMTDIPMVRLTWKDALDSDGTWTNLEDILAHECAVCQEVGWLILNDAEQVIVMRSRIVEEELQVGSSYIAIPQSWILKIEELRVNEETNSSLFSTNLSTN
jgi:hypothetical protein